MKLGRRALLAALAATPLLALRARHLPQRLRQTLARHWRAAPRAPAAPPATRSPKPWHAGPGASPHEAPPSAQGPRVVPLVLERIGPADELAG